MVACSLIVVLLTVDFLCVFDPQVAQQDSERAKYVVDKARQEKVSGAAAGVYNALFSRVSLETWVFYQKKKKIGTDFFLSASRQTILRVHITHNVFYDTF